MGCLFFLGSTARGQLPGQSPAQAAYTSPYTFASAITDPALTEDFRDSPQAVSHWHDWSTTPYASWQDFRVIRGLHSTWGPRYRDFAAPAGTETRSKEWFQERIIAAAAVMRNTTPYAHHHMGQWEVPDEPRWRSAGFAPGYGIDCSSFTRFVYDYGAGISLNSGIHPQSDLTQATLSLADGKRITIAAQRLCDVQTGYVKDYATLVGQLEPGDLLYIRGNAPLDKPVTHVILWLGSLAHDGKGLDAHLIMDSHGAVVRDSNGNLIPSGPEIRPFRPDSYYYHSFDHVLRYFPLRVVP